MTIASIDIGTNTVLLLVARVDSSGTIVPLAYEQRIPRLGKGVDASKNLAPDAMQRVLNVLLEYNAICSRYPVERIVVCATSAVREAHNSEQFASLIRSRVGFELEILSGEEEAYWTYRGAVSGIPGTRQAAVVDIGGGSTEITVGAERSILHSVSLDVGSVRLTERYFKHDPPTEAELERAIAVVEDEIEKASEFNVADTALVGVAGTATTLALLAQGKDTFSLEAVTNYHLSAETVNELFRMLHVMPSSEIRRLSSVLEGRSDVIVAGTLILREIMEHLKFKEMIVSERGVRYGLILRELDLIR